MTNHNSDFRFQTSDNHDLPVGSFDEGSFLAGRLSRRAQQITTGLFLCAAAVMFCFTFSCMGFNPHAKRGVVLPSPQRMQGDPQRGWDYLIYGNYLTSGVPLEMFQSVSPRSDNVLQREGANATVPYDFTVINSEHNLSIVVANCLQCHADRLDGQFIVGLGNSRVDFTRNYATVVAMTDSAIVLRYGFNSLQRQDYQRFRDTMMAVAPYIKTAVRGVNPADKLAFLLAAHRDPETLRWVDPPEIPESLRTQTIPSDVPAWWLLKKKNAMFYNASGRGDFSRTMMASSLVTLTDTQEAEKIDRQFVDVYAYLLTIESPPYQHPIDLRLAKKGQRIFQRNCSSCHGTYGENPTYPNRVIRLDRIGTDPALAESALSAYQEFVEAYNTSWFANGPDGSRLEPQRGYLAPPLDGIWATAPYLHNGSVPTLATLLESSKRPQAWERIDTPYDYENVGLKYTVKSNTENANDTRTYRTNLRGYGNGGHRFGDRLLTSDRWALIEYLKSL